MEKMGIKDLTKEQLLEVANLLFPWMDDAINKIETFYTDGIVDYGNGITDNEGEVQGIRFKINYHKKLVIIRCWIGADLGCDVDMFTETPLTIERLPSRNQYKIQNLFRKWKIKPKYIKDEKK